MLDTTFNMTATMINQKIKEAKQGPKSPIFKKQGSKKHSASKQPSANFGFELKEVRECLN